MSNSLEEHFFEKIRNKMNIEHPMVAQMNDFGYPKSYWSYDMTRYGYQTEIEESLEGFEEDETSDDV
ncbi:hypothetical protein ACEQPO_23340 [Bacillus sp. SL00103]